MPNKPLRAALCALACFTVAISQAQSSLLHLSLGYTGHVRHRELRAEAEMATQAYGDTIKLNADEFGVDPALVVSVIMVESRGDAGAVSRSGAMGLMQLMPSVCSDFGVADPFDPSQNIRGGVALLSRHLRKYQGDLKKVLAAYNAGPRRVDNGSWVKRAETRRYVPAVLAYYTAIRTQADTLPDYMRPGSGTAPSLSAPVTTGGSATTLDAMFEVVKAKRSKEDPSATVAENGTLDDVAQQLIGEYLSGELAASGFDQRLKAILQNGSFEDRDVHAYCLMTSATDGFSAAWANQPSPNAALVGLAHGSRKGQHVWLVVTSG